MQRDREAFRGFDQHELLEVFVNLGGMLYIPILCWHSLDRPGISLANWWASISREQHDKVVRAIRLRLNGLAGAEQRAGE